MSKILDRIDSPNDLKKLTYNEMEILSTEVREAVLNRVSNIGGHVGPNLGIVEITIAMHYVFNTPEDKIVFDVSHQCYPHKILTGRKHGFLDSSQFENISGYTNPDESEYDVFRVGHTSTSVSLACGLAKARDLNGGKENVIAVIGDGSVSGGEAFEGFDNAAELNSNIIIIVNDNDMSIAENHGGIYNNLKLLRDTDGKAECNFFKALGFDYRYVRNGNDLKELIEVFKEVKDIDHPIVLHINTLKGKGFDYAENSKEVWHFRAPFDIETGELKNKIDGETYPSLTSKFLLEKAKKDNSIAVITAAVPGICGFDPKFRKELGKQYIDVGIAEEHAIAFASGLAKNGAKPILGMHSSFIQRTYDQLSQDLAMNNSPVVILVYCTGISKKDITHLGIFDIPLVSNIPNIVYLAPTSKEEYLKMLDWGICQNEGPVVIRVPSDEVFDEDIEVLEDYSKLNKYKVEKEGKDIAIIGLGNFYRLGKEVLSELKEKMNIDATLINPRYITGIDEGLLENLKKEHKVVITLEDGILDGGFGEKIARFYGDSDMKVLNYGAKKEFVDRNSKDELFNRYRLKADLIVEDIKRIL